MSKTLCDRKEALKRDPEAFAQLTDAPRFFCKKCGRRANRKKYVCKPRRLHSARRAGIRPGSARGA